MNRLSNIKRYGTYAVLLLIGFIIVYPLLWLFFSSFKATNEEIFGSMDLLPKEWTLDSFAAAWKGVGDLGLGVFFLNTITLVVPTVALTVLSSSFVAYGFARFDFPFKKPLFSIMIATLMLPYAVLIIPRYLLFNSFGWIDTYWPFIVPSAFGGSAFFIFLMVQFMRGIPRELDESAKIDGCGSFMIYRRIIMPLCKPALFSVGIFQFVWTWNDFFNSMIFINSTEKFTLSLALRMTFDSASAVEWNKILAMSLLAIIPCVVLFFFSQRYFVEGISTSGIKG